MDSFYTALTLISGLCWTGVYLIIIYRGFKDRTCGMPLYALALNLSWELLYAFVFNSGFNPQRVINVVWFACDLVILYTYLRFGRAEWPANIHRRWYVPWCLAAVLVGLVTQYAAQLEFPGLAGAMYSAFTINLVMSVLFIAMLVHRAGVAGQSLWVAVLKWLGTLAPTILFYRLTGSRLERTLGILITCFDLLYLGLLLGRFKALGLNPITRRPLRTVG